MVSVLIPCYSRQDQLNITLPMWGKQEGVDYELVIGIGPGIVLPPLGATNITIVELPAPFAFCNAYNRLLEAAKGEVLLITQCDMQVNSTTQLKRMLELLEYKYMVGENFFKDGHRHPGMYLQFLMVRKEDVVAAGGWCERYDNNTYAFEDSDLIACMIEAGVGHKFLATPESEGVYHINHEKPDIHTEPYKTRLANAHTIYCQRHKLGPFQLYVKDFVRRHRTRRV